MKINEMIYTMEPKDVYVELDLDDLWVPESEMIDFRPPEQGDYYLGCDGEPQVYSPVTNIKCMVPRIILRSLHKRRLTNRKGQ